MGWFLFATDLHYEGDCCDAWLEAVIRRMRAHPEPVEFCLLGGDLSSDGLRPRLLAVRQAFERLGLPVYPVPGNHDWRAEGDRSDYDALFPGRTNYAFSHDGWLFLALDTTEGPAYEGTAIPRETLAQAEALLAAADPTAPILLFTHFPLGPGVPMRPRNAEALLACFEGRRLRAALSGHYHGLTERRWPVADGAALLLTSRSCSGCPRGGAPNHDGSPEKGYLLCRTLPDGLFEWRFVEVRLGEGGEAALPE